jgi:methionyl-tRNA synthetase
MYVEQTAPWSLAKQGASDTLAACLYNLSESIRIISRLIYPFMPASSANFLKQLSQDPAPSVKDVNKWGVTRPGARIRPEILFSRK